MSAVKMAARNARSARRLRDFYICVSGGTLCMSAYCLYSGHEKFYSSVVMPAVRLIDPERSHRIAVKMSSWGLVPRPRYKDPETLSTRAFGLEFCNPVGVAAGFDKHAEAMSGMFNIGFGFVEVGSVTPEPQPGNNKPRVFRLTEDNAIINRYGFNSVGLSVVKSRLENWRSSRQSKQGKSFITGVNLGKNKTTETASDDYLYGIRNLGPVSDYIVVNVSSPNTEGLRKLQGKKNLQDLLDMVLAERDKLPGRPPILLKIAPDLTEDDKHDIADVITRKNKQIDGLIVSNTTTTRPSSLHSVHKHESGGLSGEPVKHVSTQLISDMYRLTKGGVVIIGCGGIFSGDDAYEKIKAGASLVQLYSALALNGPPVITKIKQQLDQLIRQDGYENISQAVGADHVSS